MGKNDESFLLKNQLCFPIYLCSKEIIRKYNTYLKDLDLTYTQYIVMMYFWENEKSNVKKIEKTLLLDSSTLTPLLKKLEKKGFITRKKSQIDGRNLEVLITNKGKKLKERATFINEKMNIYNNLTKEEKNSLYKLIYKILMKVEGNDYYENNRN